MAENRYRIEVYQNGGMRLDMAYSLLVLDGNAPYYQVVASVEYLVDVIQRYCDKGCSVVIRKEEE